jgi:hypothetical protein
VVLLFVGSMTERVIFLFYWEGPKHLSEGPSFNFISIFNYI